MYKNYLSQDIKFLKGVGPIRANIFSRDLGIKTLEDLLFYFPYKYIDCSKLYKIKDLYHEEIENNSFSIINSSYILLEGYITKIEEINSGKKKYLKAIYSDGMDTVDLVWFSNILSIKKKLKINQLYRLLGKPNIFNGRFSFSHPELEFKIDAADYKYKPIYRLPEKLTKKGITNHIFRSLVLNALLLIEKSGITETLPHFFLKKYHLIEIHSAIKCMHFPSNDNDLRNSIYRFKFEELFYLQLKIIGESYLKKSNQSGFIFKHIGKNFISFYNDILPFELTYAQKNVIKEIRRDLRYGKHMNRLLQGDVGSGKTIVALLSTLMALDNGFQACLLAPTEILAEQHFIEISSFLQPLGICVELLTGTIKGKKRQSIINEIKTGHIKILVGTHAILEDNVTFQNLGLAIIDEQHRFGVKQRAKLWTKNVTPPHILVMTATPIPRTLSMTLYGDLEISVINQLPPGRKPIQTYHYFLDETEKLITGLRKELRKGHQVYIIYPLVKENEKLDLKNAEEGYLNIVNTFPEYNVGLLHGQQNSATKEKEMSRFVTNEIQILVSTTVIEVGVNVPNASVIVIMQAERFGLAQLHQLRGRVGRGTEQSYCILVSGRKIKENTVRRLNIMCSTNDGFIIAEEDLKLRGPGDIEGTAQSGLPIKLKVANLIKDSKILEDARKAAIEIVANDPLNNLPQNEIFRNRLQQLQIETSDYSSIS